MGDGCSPLDVANQRYGYRRYDRYEGNGSGGYTFRGADIAQEACERELQRFKQTTTNAIALFEKELDPYAEDGRWCAIAIWIKDREELGTYIIAFNDAGKELGRKIIR